MTTTQQYTTERLTPLQVVILFLSVYVLCALFAQLVFKLSPAVNKALDIFDFVVCMVFLFEFFFNLYRAPSKWQFLKWGWIDLISSIPAVGFLRVGRAVRILRILRLLRAFKSTKTIMIFLFKNRAKGALASAALISFFLVVFSSIAILTFEDSVDSHIKTSIDAVWWAFSTISSTGSGDAYPVSTEGKILAIVMSICGIGLFGTLTAFIAKYFIAPSNEKEENEIAELRKEMLVLQKQIELLVDRSNNGGFSSVVSVKDVGDNTQAKPPN